MKNTIKSIGLAFLVGIAGAGCHRSDNILKEYSYSGQDFNNLVGETAYWSELYPKRDIYNIHSADTWRNYPTVGAIKPLPRAEVKEYESGKKVVDLYYPKE